MFVFLSLSFSFDCNGHFTAHPILTLLPSNGCLNHGEYSFFRLIPLWRMMAVAPIQNLLQCALCVCVCVCVRVCVRACVCMYTAVAWLSDKGMHPPPPPWYNYVQSCLDSQPRPIVVQNSVFVWKLLMLPTSFQVWTYAHKH